MKYPKGVVVDDSRLDYERIEFKKEDLIQVVGIVFETRKDGEFVGCAFYLDKDYDWVLIEDSMGATCAVPRKKGGEDEP